jgi:hypothetical protein
MMPDPHPYRAPASELHAKEGFVYIDTGRFNIFLAK